MHFCACVAIEAIGINSVFIDCRNNYEETGAEEKLKLLLCISLTANYESCRAINFNTLGGKRGHSDYRFVSDKGGCGSPNICGALTHAIFVW